MVTESASTEIRMFMKVNIRMTCLMVRGSMCIGILSYLMIGR